MHAAGANKYAKNNKSKNLAFEDHDAISLF
jgi:hypothetical protein